MKKILEVLQNGEIDIRFHTDFDPVKNPNVIPNVICRTAFAMVTRLWGGNETAVLAVSQKEADAFGQEAKRMYSMWFSRRYNEQQTLQKMDVKALCLDTDWYVRNALAYILRNALDNGCNVNEYRWSGYRAMFLQNKSEKNAYRQVSTLTKSERRRIMHTGDRLDDVNWQIDGNSFLS